MSLFPFARLPFSAARDSPATLPPLRAPIFLRHNSNSSSSVTSTRVPSWVSSALTKVASNSSGASVTRTSRASSTSSTSSSVTHRFELISLTPSSTPTSPYFSLVLRAQDWPTKTQDAVFYCSEATALCYSPASTACTNTFTSTGPTTSDQICTSGQRDMITRVLSKAPQHIFQDTNFGNPWYILEILEIRHSDPYFSLVPRYTYQLLISSLKDSSQLFLRKSEGQERHQLYERSGLTYMDKLGKLACRGYLGEDDTEDNSRPVFIKTLDLSAGPEENGDPVADRMDQIKSIYEEINLLNSMPMHPNLTLPPLGYITLGSEEGAESQGRKIVGYVNHYYENGRLSDYIFRPWEPGHPRTPKSITLLQKAKWALQITSVMMHLHREGIYMGDGCRGFGLERFMVDNYMQLHLGGFGASEKVSQASWRVSPEARIRGEWEVVEERAINNRGNQGLKKLVWKHSDYVRLRWEQDNLAGVMDDINPFITPPSLTKSAGNGSANKVDSSSISIDSNSTIGKSNRDSSFSTSNTQSYDIYQSNGITKELDQLELCDNGTTDGGEIEEKERSIKKGNEGEDEKFAQKQQAAIIGQNWSAFEEWRHIPKAIEAIETYSLGVMLWLLFEQVPPDTFSSDGGGPVIAWSESKGVPIEWRTLVEACVKKNPADRIGMDEVLGYFVGEVGRRWDGGWLTG